MIKKGQKVKKYGAQTPGEVYMEIKGIIAAMATAMYEDGSINESEIRNQVNRHIRAGVDGIFCLGTNGVFYILSTE